MNKYTILLILFLGYIGFTYGQKNIVYDSKKYCLSITIIGYKILEPNTSDSLGTPLIEAEDLSVGFVHSNDSMFTCYDTIRLAKYKFEFKKIDAFRIVATNKTPFFRPGEILYAKVITDSLSKPVQYLSWKNGKPHGNWEYILDGGSKFVLY